jgi:lipopolysaccharide/colanic/teichoic acid biosynthesis glycosyltransferase
VHRLKLSFVPSLAGLHPPPRAAELQSAIAASSAPAALSAPGPEVDIQLPAYFRFKRVGDIVLGLVLLIVLLPLMVLVAAVVLVDVGSPVLFWQQRIGLGGRPFLLHKFRTLKPAFDERGMPVGTTDRVSAAGALIRKLRLDELPQLLSVLVGDMSLIGPRPLLPHDQPDDPAIRIMVKPGITGWAQVNGGKSLLPEKKAEYDEWYIRNASFWLDLRILLKTFGFILRGERPSEESAASPREITNSARPHN